MKSVAQYAERFGKPVPIKSLGNLEDEEIISAINSAIQSGKPVPEWEKMDAKDVFHEKSDVETQTQQNVEQQSTNSGERKKPLTPQQLEIADKLGFL